MIPKDILNYGYEDAIWAAYPEEKAFASELAKNNAPLYFYSYAEDCCFRVSHGRFFKKFRGVNPELIDKSRLKEVLIGENRISEEGFNKLTSEKKTVVISKEEYDKFSNTYTPWRKSLLRMLFDECTENASNINYSTLGMVFNCEGMTPVEIINEARTIKGLPQSPFQRRTQADDPVNATRKK